MLPGLTGWAGDPRYARESKRIRPSSCPNGSALRDIGACLDYTSGRVALGKAVARTSGSTVLISTL